jgi:hypothetical protein
VAVPATNPVLRSRARRSVKRPAALANQNLIQAALLYEHYDRPYFRSMRDEDEKQVLIGQCLPAAQEVPTHPILFLCPPQQTKYGGQCDAILQSPRINGHKELHTGLRVVPLPQVVKSLVSAAYVADYKADYRVAGTAQAAVILVGKPENIRPGWMLLLVTNKAYRSNSRPANVATALAVMGEALPLLPEWLAQLTPTDV